MCCQNFLKVPLRDTKGPFPFLENLAWKEQVEKEVFISGEIELYQFLRNDNPFPNPHVLFQKSIGFAMSDLI